MAYEKKRVMQAYDCSRPCSFLVLTRKLIRKKSCNERARAHNNRNQSIYALY